MPDNLVVVENLSKKFCSSLRRSLWYGIKEIGAELTGSGRKNVKLRKKEFWSLDNINFEIKKGATQSGTF